jgi:hypothetical protein
MDVRWYKDVVHTGRDNYVMLKAQLNRFISVLFCFPDI